VQPCARSTATRSAIAARRAPQCNGHETNAALHASASPMRLPLTLTRRMRRLVALLLLLAMPMQVASAATFTAGGEGCCGGGAAKVSVLNAFFGQPCTPEDALPIQPRDQVTRITDCVAPPSVTAAPCGDCALHCGAGAWLAVSFPVAACAVATPFVDALPPLARITAPRPARLERPPSLLV
jgi:hypothetical protein